MTSRPATATSSRRSTGSASGRKRLRHPCDPQQHVADRELERDDPGPLSSAIVSVHAQDAAGNWGPFATIDLTVDYDRPVDVRPRGQPCRQQRQLRPEQRQPVGPRQRHPQRRRLRRRADRRGRGLHRRAGHRRSSTAPGSPSYATDGTFNSPTEAIYADIPLNTINALTSTATTRSASTARTRVATGDPRPPSPT